MFIALIPYLLCRQSRRFSYMQNESDLAKVFQSIIGKKWPRKAVDLWNNYESVKLVRFAKNILVSPENSKYAQSGRVQT